MAGLVSPKPVSYLQQSQPQYNQYQRNLLYSDTPPLPNHLSNQTVNQFVGVLGNGLGGNAGHLGGHEEGKLFQLVIDLMDPNTREAALLELSKKREQYDDLAMILWHSFGMYSLSNSIRTDADDTIKESCQHCSRRLSLCILCFPHPISRLMYLTESVMLWLCCNVSPLTRKLDNYS